MLTLKYENMVRTSSSKPMSIILSASSRQRYLHTSRVTIFLFSMSIRRPGVATMTCTPRLRWKVFKFDLCYWGFWPTPKL